MMALIGVLGIEEVDGHRCQHVLDSPGTGSSFRNSGPPTGAVLRLKNLGSVRRRLSVYNKHISVLASLGWRSRTDIRLQVNSFGKIHNCSLTARSELDSAGNIMAILGPLVVGATGSIRVGNYKTIRSIGVLLGQSDRHSGSFVGLTGLEQISQCYFSIFTVTNSN
jgi:hypothetical protein